MSRYLDLIKLTLDKFLISRAEDILDCFIEHFKKNMKVYILKILKKYLDIFPHSRTEINYYNPKKLTHQLVSYLV